VNQLMELGVSSGSIASEIAVDLITVVPEEFGGRCRAALRRIASALGGQLIFIARPTRGQLPGYRVAYTASVGHALLLEGTVLPADEIGPWGPGNCEMPPVVETLAAPQDASVLGIWLADAGFRSVLLAPLKCRGYPCGCLGVAYADRGNGAGATERGALEEVAEIIGNVLDRADAESALDSLRWQRRASDRKAVDTQEQEYRSLARELHDDIGPYLTAIKTEATMIAAKAGNLSVIESHVASIKEQVDHIYFSVHGLIRRLRSTALDELGFEGALRSVVAGSTLNKLGVKCELEIYGSLDNIDDTVASSILRVLQESLTNVARHAGARKVSIVLERRTLQLPDRRVRYRAGQLSGSSLALKQDTLILRVRDDGIGMTKDQARHGMGILGMRERIEALGGKFRADGRRGSGTEVIATIGLAVNAGTD